MLSYISQAAMLALAVQASAASMVKRQSSTGVVPLGSGTDVFTEGGACKASWTPDTSGASTWKSMTIDLMTGANLNMKKLATVVSGIDGTSTSTTSYTYQCPEVSPNAAIYFLQYTHDNEQDPTWTTRFAIAGADGKVSTAPHANQPAGGSPAIPWGNGKLSGSSKSESTLQAASGSSASSTTTSMTSSNDTSSNSNASSSGSVSSDSTGTTSADSSNSSATTTPQQAASSSTSSSSGAASLFITSAGIPVAIAAAIAAALL